MKHDSTLLDHEQLRPQPQKMLLGCEIAKRANVHSLGLLIATGLLGAIVLATSTRELAILVVMAGVCISTAFVLRSILLSLDANLTMVELISSYGLHEAGKSMRVAPTDTEGAELSASLNQLQARMDQLLETSAASTEELQRLRRQLLQHPKHEVKTEASL